MTHTPGPWRLRSFSSGYDVCVDGVMGQGSGGYFLELHHTLNERDSQELHQEFKANAHLIAAAPELLVALEEAIDTIIWMSGSADFGSEGQAHEGWMKARAKLGGMYKTVSRAKGTP